jgi:SAM-dependent methyltransferase
MSEPHAERGPDRTAIAEAPHPDAAQDRVRDNRSHRDVVTIHSSWIGRIFRQFWSLAALRGGEYNGHDPSRFDIFHLLEDPYELKSEKEIARFERTNDLILKYVKRHDAVLELGSAEGVQTAFLAKISGEITGVEVSRRAVDRARLRVRQADFICGPAEEVIQQFGDKVFDLALLCETLYLMQRSPKIMEELKRISSAIIITNYAKRAPDVEHNMAGEGWRRLENIESNGTIWWCYLWEEAIGQSSQDNVLEIASSAQVEFAER